MLTTNPGSLMGVKRICNIQNCSKRAVLLALATCIGMYLLLVNCGVFWKSSEQAYAEDDLCVGRHIKESTQSAISTDSPGEITTPINLCQLWFAEQKRRKETVARVCQEDNIPLIQYGPSTSDLFKLIVVDNLHQVLYCSVPKVASSSWRTMLALMTGKVNQTTHNLNQLHLNDAMKSVGLVPLNHYPEARVHYVLKKYKKFFLVRNPLERIVSAYSDKFERHVHGKSPFHSEYGRRIIRNYRKEPSEESLKNGADVQFGEFVRLLTDTSVPDNDRFNQHWTPFNTLCHPCLMKYDFIGKYDTLDVDNEMILHFLFNKSEFRFPKRNVRRVASADKMSSYYGNLPRTLVRQLEQVFDVDYRLFGYSRMTD